MTTTAQQPAFDAAIDKTTASLRELNELLLGEAKKTSKVAIDAYQASWRTYADYADKIAGATPAEFGRAAITAHAKAARELTGAYADAARSLIS